MLTKDQYHEYEEQNAFMSYNHIEVYNVEQDSAILKAVLTDESMNIMGYIHGGLIFTMADCAAGLTARTDGRHYVTQNVNINFIHNIKEGVIYAVASLVNRGRSIVVIHVDIYSQEGLLLAEATADMFCID